MKWAIYSPSYRRDQIAITHKLFDHPLFNDRFFYVVREEQAEQYRKSIPAPLIKIPQGSVKDIATTRNWILENKQTQYVIMIDDDMVAMQWCLKRHFKRLGPEDLFNLFEMAFQMAEDCHSGIWGVQMLDDPKAYRIYSPVSFSLPILGPFLGILDTSLRYDTSFHLKEDYDFFLQQIKKHRLALRLNYISYIVDHGDKKGGCQSYRTHSQEKAQNRLLQQKWGSKIIRSNTINPGSVNMIIKTGLGL